MSKYLLVGDSHWGMSNNNQRLIQQNIDVWNYILTIAKEYKVAGIIETGDFFDKRKEIDMQLLSTIKNEVISKLEVPLYCIVGNHNSYFKDTNRVDNLTVIEGGLVKVIRTPTKIDNIDLIPWITKENVNDIQTFILGSNSKFCVGHFEFNNFPYDKFRMAEVQEKLSRSHFGTYNKVFSGHYHIKSEKENIIYIGTPHQLTWIDVDTDKYIYILDTESNDIIQLHTNNRIYHQFNIEDLIVYKDKITNNRIKIFYDEDIDKKLLIDIQTQVQQLNPDQLQFIKKSSNKKKEQSSVKIDESKNLLDLILDYIKNINPANKEKIEFLMKKIYNKNTGE
jgi:DNA repair exonuclease SbcCD nuclease subunit